jgi:ubiquinone/menaquinone biosynthesis C-methylase UbiE
MIMTIIKLFLEYNRAIAWQVLRRNDFGNLARSSYESKTFVDKYVPMLELQKPELAILEELRSELPYFRMLDIGVGAGRTTCHFAGLVKEYVGIDYSNTMIKACRARFPRYRLEVASAGDLSLFDDDYFDFVLFSFNGIDAVEHEERLKLLREIRRVIRDGGYFSFSTLNLNSSLVNSSFRFSRNPLVLLFNIYNFLLNEKVSRTIRHGTQKLQHVMIYGRHNLCLFRSYYITPSEQLKQLINAGFSHTKAYDLTNGKIITDPTHLRDYYIYFLSIAK